MSSLLRQTHHRGQLTGGQLSALFGGLIAKPKTPAGFGKAHRAQAAAALVTATALVITRQQRRAAFRQACKSLGLDWRVIQAARVRAGKFAEGQA